VAVTTDPVAEAAEAALAGLLVVFPTDTVYGIATRPDRPDATARIFEAKDREPGLALPVLVPSIDLARKVARLDRRAERLAEAFWPGALTLILSRSDASAAWHLGGDGATVGVRIPDHPLAGIVLHAAGPLAASSANRSGEPPATTCDDLRDAFGDLVSVYLCADEPLEGAASTVLDLAHGPPTLVREGDVAPGELARFLPEGEALLDSRPSP
jgi:tRNA threonylcarbamoyl adenosine modification protein (Sua5/YciO/YrdC/YwlC family)